MIGMYHLQHSKGIHPAFGVAIERWKLNLNILFLKISLLLFKNNLQLFQYPLLKIL